MTLETIVEEREKGTVMANPSPAALQQMIKSLDEKLDDGHERLRHDYRELKAQLDQALQSVRTEIAAERMKIAEMKATPIDATKLVLTPKIVAGIIVTVVAIYGAFWASTSGLRSDVRDVLTRMETSKSLQESQANTLKTAIDEMRRRQELQQYEIQGLKEAILKQGVTPSGRRNQ